MSEQEVRSVGTPEHLVLPARPKVHPRESDRMMTKQAEKDRTDVNLIMRRFAQTGQLPTASRMPSYGDFTNVDSYQAAVATVRRAEAAFRALPADLRDRYRNDPVELLRAAESDPDFFSKLVAEGLATDKPEPSSAAPTPASSPAEGPAATPTDAGDSE